MHLTVEIKPKLMLYTAVVARLILRQNSEKAFGENWLSIRIRTKEYKL